LAVILYNIFLLLFRAGTFIASPFNGKAKKWVTGRKNIFERLEQAIPAKEKIAWIHCASLGEFEQGRPVMEDMRKRYPQYKILLTFFSPSGYEAQKNYKGVDWVFYLPVDGPKNAKRFLEIVHPTLVIFVKYEFWYYYLKKIKYREIPLLLISALFRKDMSFFKWYGGMQRKMLSRFDHLFVQNPQSKKLIDEIGLSSICTVSGDTRFDRVIEIAERFEPIEAIEKFVINNKVIVAGSTWPEDEEVLQKALLITDDLSIKLIIAPHEISEKHINEIKKLFPNSIRFSELPTHHSPLPTCLIIDNIGMLSRLYKYGWVTYIGGGMKQNGVHNVLEAAVYDRIVLFGPYYHKYTEAVGLVLSGGGLSFIDPKKDGVMLGQLLNALLQDKQDYALRSKTAGEYVRLNRGATKRIMQFIQEKRLLTS
jgi:3-deoxy-D-manno-octulosonic-acid transferase